MDFQFQETNINLDIYENLTAKDYEALEKKEHALYIVKNVGIYKGTKLIARNEDVTKLGLEKVLNLYTRNESVTDITNLTDAIIQFNDTVNLPAYSWDINFNTTNNYNDEGYWGRIAVGTDYLNNGQTVIEYYYITSQTEDSTSWSSKTVYQNGQWIDRAYQTISIIGGDSVQSSRLIEALVSNSSISMPQNNKYQLNVYEISSLDEFHLIRKDPNAFYIVANNGVYKGSVLIASSTSEDHILSLLDTTINNKIQVSINDDETIDLIIN